MDWRCAECGEPYPEDDPPCQICGHDTFEPAEDPVRGGQVWVCTQCGRQHQRHNPPCSTCGNHDLEQRDLAEVDDTLTSVDTRWRDVLEPRYVAGYLLVAVLVAILGLGFAGVIPIPGLGPEPVPGNATSVAGHDLSTVEAQFVAEMEADYGERLQRPETLGAFATATNQQYARAAVGEGDRPDLRELAREYGVDCNAVVVPMRLSYEELPQDDVGAFANESALAADLYPRWRARAPGATAATVSRVGVDVHALDASRILVTVVYC